MALLIYDDWRSLRGRGVRDVGGCLSDHVCGFVWICLCENYYRVLFVWTFVWINDQIILYVAVCVGVCVDQN